MWASAVNFCFLLLTAVLWASQVKSQSVQQWYKRQPYLPLTRSLIKRHGPQLNNPRWIKRHCVGKRPVPLSGTPNCSAKIDAITKAPNNCTYAFASSLVFEICIDNGLPQRAVYDISKLFPRGPKAVTAAVTNFKSGITILINHRVVYRYIWVNKNLPFCEVKRRVSSLQRQIPFEPTAAFQNINGRIVLTNGLKSVEYNDHKNDIITYGFFVRHFNGPSPSVVGVVNALSKYLFFYTKQNSIQVFDMEEGYMVQEYPLNVKEYFACLPFS